MAYRQIDPRAFQPGINPADQNNMAIAAGYTGWSDYLDHQNAGNSGQSSGGRPSYTTEPRAQTAEEFMNKIKEELARQMDTLAKRKKDFDTKNPFVFDEILAQNSAEERFNPYYDAELKDFVSGIERQKESVQGERDLLTELNQIKIGEDARSLKDAISSSEEGFAGAGLFFSGARERSTGKQLAQNKDNVDQRDLMYKNNIAGYDRSLGGLNENLATGQRKLNADKTTQVQTEIEKQRAEAVARREQERAQYLGPEYTKSIQGGLNQLITSAWQV